MAVTTTPYDKYKVKLLTGANPVVWGTDPIKVALLTSGYTPDFDAHDFFDDITNELTTGLGYTAGGEAIGGISTAIDTGADFAYADGTDVTWAALTATFRYAIVYMSTGTAGTSPLIMLIDFGEDQTPADEPFVLQWAAPASGGVLKVA